jgi:high potential iron-sulfur protein
VDSQDKAPRVSRGLVLRRIAGIPFAALGVGATLSAAQAADNKKQFKYQDKPGPHGQQCSGCRLFRPPSGCTVVTGKISPKGWCIAWAAK